MGTREDVKVAVKVGVSEEDVVDGVIKVAPAGVLVGLKDGVGETISGRGDGDTKGVATNSGICIPVQDTNSKISKAVCFILRISPPLLQLYRKSP